MSSILIARNLHKIYKNGARRLHVLKGVSIEVESGRMVSVVGHSGAGKSTLLHLLAGLEMPSGGEVLLDGADLYKAGEAERARIRNKKIGFVFQFYHLLPEFSAVENVMLPAILRGENIRDAKSRAEKALSELGLGERLDHKPGELSGGEQQRAAIARALINEPSILFCDEPTGNLDSQTGAQILELLVSLKRDQKRTIIVVTHEEEIADKADEVLRMRDGILIREDRG